MATWFTTPLSEAALESRWAAEFHQPGYKFTPKQPTSWRKIGRCSKLCQYGLSVKMNEEGSGVPIYRLNEIDSCFLSEAPTKFAPVPAPLVKDHKLAKGDVLFCRTNGNIHYVGRTGLFCSDNTAVFASYLVRVRTNRELLYPEFLTIYLNTAFGRSQILRRAMPSNQVNVSAAELNRIDIIVPTHAFQREVAELVRSAYTSRARGLHSYAQAQRFLESELGLDKLTFRKPVGYTTQFSEVEATRRLDSENYFPEFKHFVQSLPHTITLAPLSKHLTFCQRGKQPFYGETGLPVINSKHVQPNRVILEDNRQAIPGSLSELQIRNGDILMNGTGRGTLGRVAPYLAKENALPDNHVTILRFGTLDPVFASFYLSSRAGQMQVEMHQRGTSGQLELYPFDIRKFQIWEAPTPVQEEIRKLYDSGAAAQAKSKQLLAEANARVEQLVEEAVNK
jgi:restriction endonuclease S subunit